MITMHVKPAPGLKIRNPADPANVLPPEGIEVPINQYWSRRLLEGSVLKTVPAKLKGGK